MNSIIVFADGASLGNPGKGGWGAVVLSDNYVTELGGRKDDATNNMMELTAAIEVLSFLKNEKNLVTISTDSAYVVNGAEKWILRWREEGWKTKAKKPIRNFSLWKKLDELSFGKKIIWKRVAGHSGLAGNERVDAIASAFAAGKDEILYTGTLTSYKINLLDERYDSDKKTKKENKRNNKPAYSYASFVGGKIFIHKTWKECEAVVKGKNAKFRKTLNREDEQKLIQSWKKNAGRII
ncbi:MAG: RNase H family protein [Patescibacteria group bacterium]